MNYIDESTRGIIAVVKPAGYSSHWVINQVRRITGIRKVGHAGTLDPLAYGVLVIAIGREATKKIAAEVAKEKEYMATFKLGVESTTDDEEGDKTELVFSQKPGEADIRNALNLFLGTIYQTPPIYSAVKIQGKAAYKYARAGKHVVLKSRPVIIHSITLLDYHWPYVKIDVVTGPGVYIRSLARDLGKTLQTGAYMSELERVRVGNYTTDSAYVLEADKNPSPSLRQRMQKCV